MLPVFRIDMAEHQQILILKLWSDCQTYHIYKTTHSTGTFQFIITQYTSRLSFNGPFSHLLEFLVVENGSLVTLDITEDEINLLEDSCSAIQLTARYKLTYNLIISFINIILLYIHFIIHLKKKIII